LHSTACCRALIPALAYSRLSSACAASVDTLDLIIEYVEHGTDGRRRRRRRRQGGGGREAGGGDGGRGAGLLGAADLHQARARRRHGRPRPRRLPARLRRRLPLPARLLRRQEETAAADHEGGHGVIPVWTFRDCHKPELAGAGHEADELDHHRHGSQQPHPPVHLHRRGPEQAGGREPPQGPGARSWPARWWASAARWWSPSTAARRSSSRSRTGSGSSAAPGTTTAAPGRRRPPPRGGWWGRSWPSPAASATRRGCPSRRASGRPSRATTPSPRWCASSAPPSPPRSRSASAATPRTGGSGSASGSTPRRTRAWWRRAWRSRSCRGACGSGARCTWPCSARSSSSSSPCSAPSSSARPCTSG
ncbi:hypothetical protein U9M48_032517, partial [Paspalum notatum var. saurae]